MDLQPKPETRGLGGIFQGLGMTGDRLGEAVFNELFRIFHRGVAQNQQRHTDPAPAQLERFVETAHGQIVCPQLLQKL